MSDAPASTTAILAVATHSITVSYNGDASFITSASTTLSQVVNQAATTTSLLSATNNSVFGQPVTFTATVSAAAPGSGTPTGKVTFYDGSISLGTASLSSGSASFTAKGLPTGSDAITAVYNGDSHFTTSTSAALSQSVSRAGTTSVVTSAANPSAFGQSVTFTATVKAVAPGSGTPTGSIRFLDGSNVLGTVTLSGGKAAFKTTALGAGSHTITVSYTGDGNFVTSTSEPLTQTVNQAATPSKVTSSANPSVFGQSVTFTATVKAVAPGSATPTGTVSFLDGSTTLGTGTPSGGTAHVLDLDSRRRRALDHCDLRRRRQLLDQHVGHRDPDREAGSDDQLGELLGESLGLRPSRDVHGHDYPRVARQRHADGHGHL